MKYLLLIVLLLAYFSTLTTSVAGETVSINYDKSKTVNDVVQDIHRQTGYQIIIDEGLKGVPVRGKYTNVEIEPFLLRIFKGYNLLIITSANAKKCSVKTVGSQQGRQPQMNAGTPSSSTVSSNQNTSTPHTKQQREEQTYNDDEKEIDPLSGVSLSELREMHKVQLEEIANLRKSSDHIVDNETGMTLGQLRLLHKEQQEEIQKLRIK